MTIRIRYRILNARLAAGAVSAGQAGGVDQAYDGWRVVSQVIKSWLLWSRSGSEPVVGSKFFLVFHMTWSTTASLRTSATAARLKRDAS